jgi:hypothetical protein
VIQSLELASYHPLQVASETMKKHHPYVDSSPWKKALRLHRFCRGWELQTRFWAQIGHGGLSARVALPGHQVVSAQSLVSVETQFPAPHQLRVTTVLLLVCKNGVYECTPSVNLL